MTISPLLKHETMRHLITFIGALMATVLLHAQNNKPFSPEKFQEELERFIAKEARLTSAEQTAFFPVYREMMEKQRKLFDEARQLCKKKPTTDDACRDIIKKKDKMEMEQKKIQQTYHNKFLTILAPGKVFDVLKAEDRFHRGLLRNTAGEHQKKERK